jgi:hypothetical protein
MIEMRKELNMPRTKILVSTILAVIFLAVQVISVGAAPATQDEPPVTGTIPQDGITLETDTETGVTTVLVTLIDDMGETQTVRLSLEDASDLGLVTDDGTGNFIVDETKYDTTVEIDPATLIPDEMGDTTEEPQHPVGGALSNFFSDLLGVDYETIMDFHDNGNGFGVIAQALWMTNALDGDSDTFAAILEAKQTKDFSGITLPDGSEPQNWGQFRKAVMSDREKSKENLGAIMSGRADQQQGEDETQVGPQTSPNAPDRQTGNNKDKNKDKGNGKDNNNGNGKNKDKNKNK